MGSFLSTGAPGAQSASSLPMVSINVPTTPSDTSFTGRKNNKVVTSKYNKFDFLPRVLYLQFRRFTNLFFLLVALLMLASELSDYKIFVTPYSSIGTVAVLSVVVGVTIILEGNDDLRRHRDDHKTNNRLVTLLRRHKDEAPEGRPAPWGGLRVGDVIRIESREQIPADVVLIESSHDNGRCYIETSGIDGETNLKIKQVPQGFREHIAQCGGDWRKAIQGSLEHEVPNAFLQFNGTFAPADKSVSKTSIDFGNVILRGSQLRNTDHVIAMVVYAGHETKLVMSKRDTPTKFSLIDIFVNRMMIYTMVIYFLIVTILAYVLVATIPDTDDTHYFKNTSNQDFLLPPFVAYFFTFMVLFSNLVPINMIVCLEIANNMQAYFFNNDIEMYHKETNTAADARTSSLVAELGQITHVFSDKTGTLTKNVMRLVGVSVGNQMYGFIPPKEINYADDDDDEEDSEVREKIIDRIVDADASKPEYDIEAHLSYRQSIAPSGLDDGVIPKNRLPHKVLFKEMIDEVVNGGANAKAVSDFLIILSVCHTVVIDHDDDGNIRYNAEGPDEEALVDAAASLGFRLQNTENGTFVVESDAMGTISYKILAVNTFNSDRKRMSVVARDSTGQYTLMMKGADNVIMKRLSKKVRSRTKITIAEHLDRFSSAGLRTLVMAQKPLTEEEFNTWFAKYEEARNMTGEARAENLAKVADMVEHSCFVVGASAIEDELQDGVPETIQMIKNAGITLWVLTGDKMQTAINIAFSAKLLDSSMYQFKLDSDNREDLVMSIDRMQRLINSLATSEIQKRRRAATKQNELVDRHDITVAVTPQSSSDSSTSGIDDMDVGDDDETPYIADGLALVLSGAAVENLITAQKGTPESEAKFLRLLRSCKVVLACRVSPIQKALIVRLVVQAPRKFNQSPPVALSIGDGANDVPMIQEARVGVGISGNEGLQAVNNSDFSVAQFRFLQRMLFVHGRWNYRRNTKLVKYMAYSWQVLSYVLLYYLFYTMVSGQQIYYNTFYVSIFPWICDSVIVAVAWFDRDISATSALHLPACYVNGRTNKDLSVLPILGMCLKALVHSLILYFGVFWIHSAGEVAITSLGTAIFTAMFFMLTAVQMVHTYSFTYFIVISFAVAIFLFFLSVTGLDLLMGDETISLLTTASEMSWLPTLWVVVTFFVLEIALRGLRLSFFPTSLDIMIELDRGFVNGERKSRQGVLDAIDVLADASKQIVMGPILIPARSVRSAFRRATNRSPVENLTSLNRRSGFDFAGPSRFRKNKSKNNGALLPAADERREDADRRGTTFTL